MVNESIIKKSFLKIKQEIDELKQENQSLQQEIIELKTDVNNPQFTNKIADMIILRIEEKLDLNKKPEIDEQPNMFEKHLPQINSIPNNIDSTLFLKSKIKTKMIDLCVQRLRPNELKKAIVNIAKLCSKATFYRYLSELKREGIIQTIELNNEVFLLTTDNISNRNIYK